MKRNPLIRIRDSRTISIARAVITAVAFLVGVGQKQTSRHVCVMSVIPLKADIRQPRFARPLSASVRLTGFLEKGHGRCRLCQGIQPSAPQTQPLS